jgi:pimeloyl-ACP methyl ester carboxylesterase
MKLLKLMIFGLILFSGACQNNTNKPTSIGVAEVDTEVSFYTSDSLQIFGDLYEADKGGSTILLFHQGGSNAKGEYSMIIPRLIETGYNVFAIDQRKGGQLYGQYNRTVANIPINRNSYCDAYPDLEAALDYIIERGYTGNKILWGSSYSASLVIKLASRRPDDISAVLAFSPASGEPMEGCEPNVLFESLEKPLLVLRPGREMEIESVQAQMSLAKQFEHQTYVAENGVHGSSMLVQERVQGGVEKHWAIVEAFIKRF